MYETMKKLNWIYILALLIFYQSAFSSTSNDRESSSDDEKLERPSRRHNGQEASSSADLYEDKIDSKVAKAKIATGYYDARLITFGTNMFVRGVNGYELRAESSDATDVKIHRQKSEVNSNATSSQLLITEGDISLATSVDTSIKTTTERKSEGKQTFIQYHKGRFDQEDKDFLVDETYKAKRGNKTVDILNYDGGHLIDHKFSAEGSHTTSFNYIPQHHDYNQHLKEFLVSSAEGYLEIPLYTPNPPRVGVKGKRRQKVYNNIPIGIILVVLHKQSISGAYYFPNNQYSYENLRKNLNLETLDCSVITPYFKLKQSLHPLLLPAIIYDGRQHIALQGAQTSEESRRVNMINALVAGMSTLNLNDEEETLATLASNTLHQKDVQLANILDIKSSKIAKLNHNQPNMTALTQSFNVLGQFLIEYAMGNALKSEVLNPTSRIMFLNIMIDFFEDYQMFEGPSLKALDYIHDTFLDTFTSSLSALETMALNKQINLENLIYFANLYQKLSTESMHAAFQNGYGVGDDFGDIYNNLSKFFEILKVLKTTLEKEKPTFEQQQNLVSLFSEAQNNLAYSITLLGGASSAKEIDPNINSFKEFLKTMTSLVKKWDKKNISASGSYQDSPNSQVLFRGINGLNKFMLGTNSSIIYPNSESENDESSGEES
jgi:hypothetical protein